MYTKREAALALGIDRNTLTKWARECGITGGEDPRDKRLSLLSDEDLRTIRERYADRHTFGTSTANRPQTASTSSADLTARLAALEATIEQLRQRAGWLFTAPTEARVATVEQLSTYEPPRRLTASTASHTTHSARQPIPAGWIHQNQWAEDHHMSPTTVKRHIKDEQIPLEHGDWIEGTTPVKHLLTEEGQAALHRHFRLDPCPDCGWSSANETPHPAATE